MTDPAVRLREQIQALHKKLDNIVKGFKSVGMNGVICTPPYVDIGNDDCTADWDAPVDRKWCAQCKARWQRLFALPDEVAALLAVGPVPPQPSTECVADCQGCRQLRAELDTLRGMREEWRAKIRVMEADLQTLRSVVPSPPPQSEVAAHHYREVVQALNVCTTDRRALELENARLKADLSRAVASPPPPDPPAACRDALERVGQIAELMRQIAEPRPSNELTAVVLDWSRQLADLAAGR